MKIRSFKNTNIGCKVVFDKSVSMDKAKLINNWIENIEQLNISETIKFCHLVNTKWNCLII